MKLKSLKKAYALVDRSGYVYGIRMKREDAKVDQIDPGDKIVVIYVSTDKPEVK